jgi:hypothetical protein
MSATLAGRGTRTRRAALAGALVAMAMVVPSAPATAGTAAGSGDAASSSSSAGSSSAASTGTPSQDPPFVGWAAVLPALAWQHQPTSEDDCVAGRTSCVRRTIREMERRLEPLAADCSHSSVFALAYLRTTEAYLRASLTDGFFRDPAFVNHQDVVFARMYFDAYDRWTAGHVEQVPPAWRIAFRAAEESQVSGVGDLLLGMNAHVNRDLPFALAAIGLVDPDGRDRKADHDQVDAMLNGVVVPLLAEEAARFDPTMEVPRTPFGLGYTALLQALVLWRENAWRQAELLAAAPDDTTRALVAAAIERNAALTAATIVAGTRYLPPLTSTADRDRFCARAAGAGG